MVHPVHWGSLSACGCQILHRTDICDHMSCATCSFQQTAKICKHIKGDKLIGFRRGFSNEMIRCSLKFSDIVSGWVDKWMHFESTVKGDMLLLSLKKLIFL